MQNPTIVSLDQLTEAAIVGQNLAMEDSANTIDIGQTMGYFPVEP